MDKRDSYTYLILGDGECNEGQIWEGAMFAPFHKLSRLIVFVDLNKQQLDGFTSEVLDMGDMVDKFKAFGWHTQKIDGHNIDEITAAISAAKAESELPSVIILNTIKGHGCSFAEGIAGNHHMNFKPEQMSEALANAEKVLAEAKAALV